jgi:FkbM family methyltransferase
VARALRSVARAGPSRPLDVTLWGLRLRLHTRGNVAEARILFLAQFWEPRERALLEARAGPGFVFVDVGANAGGYSLWVLSLLREQCTIVAVEPDPELAARLGFNAATNGAENLRVIRAALADREGEGVLVLDSRNRGENRLLIGTEGSAAGPGWEGDTPPHATRTHVPLRTLHRLVREEGLSRVDALKIDIEGMELPVLRAFFQDAPEELWPRLLITEHHGTPEHEALAELLRERGYRERLRSSLNLVVERSGTG